MKTETKGRWRSLLDVLATILIIVASICAIALTANSWLTQQYRDQRQDQSAPGQRLSGSQHSLKGAHLLGDRQAKIAIIEYADFECTFCAQFARETWPELKKRYIDTGQVLAAFKHLPLPSHQHAKGAAVSAICAGEQSRFWDMHDRLFQKQSVLDESTGSSLAQELGLNKEQFEDCALRATGEVEREAAIAKSLGINGTPSFAIGRVLADQSVSVSHLVIGAQPLESIAPLIDELLAGTR